MTIPNNPEVWPVCGRPDCGSPWAFRRVLTMSGVQWMWTRDCKHRSAEPVMHDANGPRPDIEVS